MENTHILDSGLSANFELTDQMISYIKETAKWGKFLAIVGFIFIGLMVIAGLFMGFAMGDLLGTMGGVGGVGGASGIMLMIVYIALAATYIYPTLKLYKFSTMAKSAIDQHDQVNMAYAFENLKSMFKFMGIFTAIILGFYAIIFLFSILMGGMAMLG